METKQRIDIFQCYRKEIEEREANMFHRRAALSKDHQRFFGSEDDHRLPYQRDVDRIIHSKAYARYVDKTQVVYLVANDHIAHRGLHVQLVSNFACGIAEILKFNLSLVEAISLGHDVGHAPFGHEGEGYLSALSKEYGNGPFAHPWQSCRLFTNIEPLNLGLTVLDGFLCHDGGLNNHQVEPQFDKTWDTYLAELEQKKRDPHRNFNPMTLEGCLVKLCDTISYVGRDIEDAIQIGVIKREMVPKTLLGDTNKQILNYMARDIIENSYGRDYVACSEESFEALKVLREFNFQHIYFNPLLKTESKKIKQSYSLLFDYLLHDLENHGEESYMWKEFMHNKGDDYQKKTCSVQCVVDYIAGMTDRHFIRTVKNLIIPSLIDMV